MLLTRRSVAYTWVLDTERISALVIIGGLRLDTRIMLGEGATGSRRSTSLCSVSDAKALS